MNLTSGRGSIVFMSNLPFSAPSATHATTEDESTARTTAKPEPAKNDEARK